MTDQEKKLYERLKDLECKLVLAANALRDEVKEVWESVEDIRKLKAEMSGEKYDDEDE